VKQKLPKTIPAALANELISVYSPVQASLVFDEQGARGQFFGEIPSVNKLTVDIHETRRRAAHSDVKRFKRGMKHLLAPHGPKLVQSDWYNLHLVVYRRAFGQEGQALKWDVSNLIKVAEDCICTFLGIDDCRIKEVTATKINWTGRAAWEFQLTPTEKPCTQERQ